MKHYQRAADNLDAEDVLDNMLPGVFDLGAGRLESFEGPLVNRRVARRFAREFRLRWNLNAAHEGPYKLLQQYKQMLELKIPATSGAMVASQAPHSAKVVSRL